MVATITLICGTKAHGSRLLSAAHHSEVDHSEYGQDPSPRFSLGEFKENSPTIKHIVSQARKPSTKYSYSCNCKRFVHYAKSNRLSHHPPSPHTVLCFLLQLKEQSLCHSLHQVYLSATDVHQSKGSTASQFFQHPTLKKFMKGLRNICTGV